MIRKRYIGGLPWDLRVHHPEAIGIALLSSVFGTAAAGFTIGATGITLASVLGYAVTTTALIGAQYAANQLAAKPEAAVKPTENSLNIRQAIVSRRRSYGEVKIGGITAFQEKDSGVGDGGPLGGGGGGGGQNGLFVQLLQGQGEIDEVLEHWMGDEQVLLDGTGLVDGPPFATNRFGVWIRNKLGTLDQTAHSRLVDLFEPDFSENHRWRGVPNTLIEFKAPVDVESAQAIYPYGPQPYRCVQHAAKVHDPRIDTQNPDGDPDNPEDALTGGTGWEWSDNAALVILDFIRHPDGFAVKSEREMVPISQFHIPDWIAFANLCDEPVERKDGSGPIVRYRIWGTYDLTSAPKSILDGMLAACDAELYRTGTGKTGIRGGKWDEPTLTIEGDDLLSHSMKKGNRQYASCNRVNAKYISRHHDYQQVDMDPWIDQENIDIRRLELPIDLDFPWVSHHSQARRLSKIQINKRNPAWTGTIVTGPRGLLAFNERTINVNISELGIDRSFLITSFRPSPNFATVEIGIASLDSSTYDWDPATEEGDAPEISAISMEDSILPLPENFVVEINAVLGGHEATVSWENNSGITLFGQVQYQDLAGGTFAELGDSPPISADDAVPDQWVNVPVPEDASQTIVSVVMPSMYAFRVRFVSPALKASKWVDTLVGEPAEPMAFQFNDATNSSYIVLMEDI